MRPSERYFELPYECQSCGSDDVGAYKSSEEEPGGEFEEGWYCDNCGAVGKVSGVGDEGPEQWSFSGVMFSE